MKKQVDLQGGHQPTDQRRDGERDADRMIIFRRVFVVNLGFEDTLSIMLPIAA
jgi:hypothetical protein